MSKADFKSREPGLWTALLEQQRALSSAGISTLIILAGPEGCGKGDLADRLNQWLDTRGIETHAFWTDSDEERERPYHWRFWRRLASRSRIAIMFGAWYWRPLYQCVRGETSAAQLKQQTRHIAALEQMLQQDGMLIVKFWLYLDRKTQRRRMRTRREVQRHVRGTAAEGSSASEYETFLQAADTMIGITGDVCPWYRVDAADDHARDIEVGELLLKAMREWHEKGLPGVGATEPLAAGTDTSRQPRLATIDLTARLGKSRYKQDLKHWQKRLATLSWQAYDARRSTVMVFEGWDAAGKGGIIRRLVRSVDARLYQVVPIGAPNDVERAHPYLWRFWNRLPRAGFMTLYDRSWYGRVLVERVEGFATVAEWARAYDEINAFETQLTDHGVILAKYWLHISNEEQLRRFHERDRVPWKSHKLTDDDWRNREQRPAYVAAVEDMVEHTDTASAPWRLVAAEDKRHARVSVLRDFCERMEAALDNPT